MPYIATEDDKSLISTWMSLIKDVLFPIGHIVLRSVVGMTQVLRERLVMGYAGYWNLLVLVETPYTLAKKRLNGLGEYLLGACFQKSLVIRVHSKIGKIHLIALKLSVTTCFTNGWPPHIVWCKHISLRVFRWSFGELVVHMWDLSMHWQKEGAILSFFTVHTRKVVRFQSPWRLVVSHAKYWPRILGLRPSRQVLGSFTYTKVSVLERSSCCDTLPEWGRSIISNGNFHQISPTEQAGKIRLKSISF